MFESFLIAIAAAGIFIGTMVEVVEPAVDYTIDKITHAYEYIDGELNPES